MQILEIVCLFILAVAMTPALAHALELPGKMRLSRDEYFAVQQIYYPGFTIAGFSEPAGLIAVILLALLTPWGTPSSWFVLAALVGLIGMHTVYWMFIHSVNKAWLQPGTLNRAGAGFFNLGGKPEQAGDRRLEWKKLRDQWEYSHLLRAVLAVLSFVAIVIVVASR